MINTVERKQYPPISQKKKWLDNFKSLHVLLATRKKNNRKEYDIQKKLQILEPGSIQV